MLKLASFVCFVTILALVAGCSPVSAPIILSNSVIIPVTSSNRLNNMIGSGESVIRPVEESIVLPAPANLSLGSGENVVRPGAESIALPASTNLSFGSGENVVRPDEKSIALPASANLSLGSGENVVRPVEESFVKSAPQPLDLGAGYTLRDGQIVAPASIMKVQPETSQKFDIGGGYWLVLTGNSGEIVH